MSKKDILANISEEFIRWYFKTELNTIIPEDETKITVDDIISGGTELEIDITESRVIDEDGETFELTYYLCEKLKKTHEQLKENLRVRIDQWEQSNADSLKDLKYHFNDADCSIFDSKGNPITDFLIYIDAEIRMYDIQEKRYLREYSGRLQHIRNSRRYTHQFRLRAVETCDLKAFKKCLWEIETLTVWLKKDIELQEFIKHLVETQKPKTVIQHDFTGLFNYQGTFFYITKNLLAEVPTDPKKSLKLISPDEDGTFPIGKNQYFSLSDELNYLPFYNLDSPLGNRYLTTEKALYSGISLDKALEPVEHHLMRTIGGESSHGTWGKLLIGYIFSFVFQDVLKKHFNHGVYLYIYGKGNSGKGEISKVIQSFFGASENDRLMNATKAMVDLSLMKYSDRPLILDEFKPKTSDKDAGAKIEDQVLNGWYQWEIRANLTLSNGRKRQEAKEVRTMLLFISNFIPYSEHFLSRCSILEYSAAKRGHEKHLKWLQSNANLLQLIYLSFLDLKNKLPISVIRNDFDCLRSLIKDKAKECIKMETGVRNPMIKDRPVDGMTIMTAFYMFSKSSYRQKRIETYNQNKVASESNSHGQYLINDDNEWESMLDDDVIDFAVQNVVKASLVDINKSPFTSFLNTIHVMIQQGYIKDGPHYKWIKSKETGLDDLVIKNTEVYEIYRQYMKGRDDIVPEDLIRSEFENKYNGLRDGSTYVIGYIVDNRKISYRGFRIFNDNIDELLASTFNYPKIDDIIQANALESVSSANSDDELPF